MTFSPYGFAEVDAVEVDMLGMLDGYDGKIDVPSRDVQS